jgi:hypothetical protein
MEWSDPAARLALIEKVGPDRYNEMLSDHQKASVIEIVNGHAIRTSASRFGKLFIVGETGRAFSTMNEAVAFAGNSAGPTRQNNPASGP